MPLAHWKDADPDIPVLKQAKASTRSCNSPVVSENPHRSSSDVRSSDAQFTAFERFRKIAFSIDS